MIRSTTPDDIQRILELVKATGLFKPNEMEFLQGVLCEHFKHGGPQQHWITDEHEGNIIGAAFFGYEPMSQNVWNMYMIAVDPAHHGKGHGQNLLHYVEESVRELGGRVLLIETSSLDIFKRTRQFYHLAGYEEEARIRDYYKLGESKIIFRKVLSA